jgi:ribosome maturation factor RimP
LPQENQETTQAMSQKQDEIEALLAPAIEALELELLGVEFSAGNANGLLRIYIDAEDRAITLDDCESVSREVSALLDVHDPIDSHYTLEVSSPGLARPLFKPEHFSRFAGEVAKVEVDLPIDGRRRFQGRILQVQDAIIGLDQDGREVSIPHANVNKARLVPVYEPPAKPGKASKKKSNAKSGSQPGDGLDSVQS